VLHAGQEEDGGSGQSNRQWKRHKHDQDEDGDLLLCPRPAWAGRVVSVIVFLTHPRILTGRAGGDKRGRGALTQAAERSGRVLGPRLVTCYHINARRGPCPVHRRVRRLPAGGP
jgi:hypothetical protein